MDFQTAVRTVVMEKYADFTGRARRSEYWWFFLFNIILAVVFNILAQIAGIFAIVSLLVSLALLIPGIAVGVRRLHDLGKSGWWLLIAFVPIVGALVLIYWFIQEGEPQANDWGEPPAPVTA